MWGGKDGVIKQHLGNMPRSFHTTWQPVVCVARRYISIDRANHCYMFSTIWYPCLGRR